MSALYAFQISCNLNGIKQRFLLDTIDSVKIKTSSSLSSHPIAQGDYVGDHMYREQATVSIEGKWGMNVGSNLNLGEGRLKLITFQSVFETIKNKAIICELLQISKNEKTANRFLKRTNMVLTSIDWVENINSLDFSFTFTQIITSNAATNASSYSKISQSLGTFDSSDAYLPSYDVSIKSSFTSLSINYIAIISTLIKEIFYQNENTIALYNRLKMLGKRGLTSLKISNEDASIVEKVLSNYALNDVDEIFINGFKSLITPTSYLRKYNSKSIKNNDIVNGANYILKIYDKIVSLNNNVFCYQPSSSGEQSSLLLINNITYMFEFKRNNTNNTYYLSVKNNNVDNSEYVVSSVYCESAVTSFSDCSIIDSLLKSNKTQVYLLKSKNKDASLLNNYFILLTNILPLQFTQELNMIINEEA